MVVLVEVALAVTVGVELGAKVAVAVGVRVGVAVRVAVPVGDDVGVAVGVRDGVAVAVDVVVTVGVEPGGGRGRAAEPQQSKPARPAGVVVAFPDQVAIPIVAVVVVVQSEAKAHSLAGHWHAPLQERRRDHHLDVPAAGNRPGRSPNLWNRQGAEIGLAAIGVNCDLMIVAAGGQAVVGPVDGQLNLVVAPNIRAVLDNRVVADVDGKVQCLAVPCRPQVSA